MKFELDNQTIKDLEIFGDRRSNSVFKFYDQTITLGGKEYLRQLMEKPLTDLHELQKRSQFIKYISSVDIELDINYLQLDFIDTYTQLYIPPLRNNLIDAYFQSLSYKIKPTKEYYLIQSGIRELAHLMLHITTLVAALKSNDIPEVVSKHTDYLYSFVSNKDFDVIKQGGNILSFKHINKLDYMFRRKYKHELRRFLHTIYLFDAYYSVRKVAKKQRLTFPEYIDSAKPYLSIEKLHHPLLKGAIPYNVEITDDNNLCFLTGPNMAGKSTYLKSIGIAIYIAHLGFPVPAQKMKTSVYNGIITTINLSDNMNRGYSHFYSEVRRVKEAAIKLKEKNRLFVIFDELFRGTNVKDAFDASLLIIESFAKINRSTFFISTHITEVAEKLGQFTNIDFKYFDSELIDDNPVYNYELKDGVSHERLGMHIVRNENIIDILNSISEK